MQIRRLPIAMYIVILTLLALPFSYYPLLKLGSVSGVHIDVSFLYILVILSVLLSLPRIIRQWYGIWSVWPLRLLIVFNLYQTISIFWTANYFRSLVTTAFVWLLIGFVCMIIAWYPVLASKRLSIFWQKGLIAVAIIVSIWVLWQIFADTIGASSWTLLTLDYQSGVFGVARPTGFALEPQFFANILLIPFCWFLVHAIKTPRRTYWIFFTLSFSLLLLTLSRGALLAAFVGLLLSLIFMVRSWKQAGLIVASLAIGGLTAILIIFTAGQINLRDNISGADTVRRSISQLTLNVIQLPHPSSSHAAIPSPVETSSSGYVATSTSSRLSMTDAALSLWRTSPSTILFGVGSGGFGAALHQKQSAFPVGSVVNNYYIETLTELGIVGLGLFIGFLGTIFVLLIKRRNWTFVILLGAIVSQMWFFSGNANIIHIWAIIGLALASLTNNKIINHCKA